ncbi:uncharacterized protein FYW61_011903 [Anableps anableps]
MGHDGKHLLARISPMEPSRAQPEEETWVPLPMGSPPVGRAKGVTVQLEEAAAALDLETALSLTGDTGSEERKKVWEGSSALTDVFVQTGEDLILNLTEADIPPNSRLWLWQFTDETLVEFKRGSKPETHTGRIEVLEKTYNVKLKNLQKSHSGIYTAKVITPQEQKLTQYNVTVQDPVSQLYLTFSSKSSTSSSSILSVTCRADDSSISISLRCEDQEGGESRCDTKSGVSLCIYQLKELIICNHSNQVSKSESTEKIEDHCIQYGKTS